MARSTGSHTVDLWSLREDVVVEPDETGEVLVLRGRLGTERISRPGPLVREALRRMELGPVLLANIEEEAEDTDGEGSTYLVLLPTLRPLSHLIVRTLGIDDLNGPLLSVSATSRHATFAPVRVPARRRLRLPGGVSLTLEKAGFVLEATGSPHRVQLHRPEAVWVVGLLAWPITPDAASAALPLPAEVTEAILGYLAAAGMAAPVGDEQPGRAAPPPVNQPWDGEG
ncbi:MULTISPECIES: NADH oxidase [unclassified Streptomyces]|uniref:NADH oxidase n=1 Tax=unclassified Streptomyces TaxID=2593676 RepID=UPI0022535DBA|nr:MULTISPECIES: NADH oxidase [unclassified Streptomyces]MCX5141939.1 NADH oxidase [Streptomyces sp. NBC_00338]WRZ66413.1 NADH oxidase [Streptomyces sp. NBC_01257]